MNTQSQGQSRGLSCSSPSQLSLVAYLLSNIKKKKKQHKKVFFFFNAKSMLHCDFNLSYIYIYI